MARSSPSLRELFETAADLGEAERKRYLDAHCGAVLRERIERMLSVDGGIAGALPAAPAAAMADALAESSQGWVAPVGSRIGPFELLGVIGEGGSSTVFRASRMVDGVRQDVALKLLRRSVHSSAAQHQYRRELQALSQLRHPGIARLIEGGVTEGGGAYIALELVDGAPITEFARTHRLDARARLTLFVDVCAAVDAAHRALIVHRDLKPSNVLIDGDGKVKLLDFGIAKLLSDDDETHTHIAAFTPAYASPEQRSGGFITTATDVYSLGIMLGELMTGERLGEDPSRTPSSCVHEGHEDGVLPASTQVTRRLLRGDLDNIVLKALQTEPAQRYASAGRLADDIVRLLDGRPVAAHPPSRWYRARKFIGRHRGGVASTLVFALAILASLGIAVWQGQAARVQAAVARAEATRADAIRQFLVGVFDHAEPDANHGEALSARQLLEGGERELTNGSLPPDTRLDLGVLLARLYWDLGDFDRAQRLLAQGVAGASHADVPAGTKARILLAVAKVEVDKRLFDAAGGHVRQAAEIAGTLGPSAFDLQSDARRISALALLGKDDAKDAEPELRTAIALDRAHYGEPHASVIEDALLLGNALTEQSRFDESIPLLRSALAQARRLHGPVHSQLAAVLQELSGAQSYSGDYAGSEASSREAADIDERIYGLEHNETLVARGNQYWSVERAGRYAEALQGRLAFVPMLEKIATTRPETAAAWFTSIAQDQAKLGRYDDAETMFRKSLATWEALQGSNDEWDSADPMIGLADALRWAGRYDEAIPMLRRAIAIETRHEPADSGWLNRDRGTLGDMLRQQGRYVEALNELDEAARARRGAKPDPLLASLMAQLAQAQLDTGSTEAAYDSATRAVGIARGLYHDNQWGLGYPLFSLARVELARGHAEVAEGLMREALASRSALPRADAHVLEIQATRVGALASLGRDSEARDLRAAIEPLLVASASPYAAILRRRLEATSPASVQ